MFDPRCYPKLIPFERLHIHDGLTIDADRWQQAHRYHRQRQNFYYQSLHSPGIVQGLGVSPLHDQPDGRLLQIQPGMAIDIEGNPIVMTQPEEFRIQSEARDGKALQIYLVVNYVDPEDLRHAPDQITVREQFRIVEKLQLDSRDVELCRIQLLPGVSVIETPSDVFFPKANQLDFRDRKFPKVYPEGRVNVGQIVSSSDRPSDLITANGLVGLLRSVAGLYPSLSTNPTIAKVTSHNLNQIETAQRELGDCHLICIADEVLQNLANPALQNLKGYMMQGGSILVLTDFVKAQLVDLLDLQQELQEGMQEARRNPDLHRQIGSQIETEITANQTAVMQRIDDLKQALDPIASQLGIFINDPGDLHPEHPLRIHPFTFNQLPQQQDKTIYIQNWGGLVWMVGDLSRCWGSNGDPDLDRMTLRSAQEWGINLLHFAVQRKEWLRSMTSHTP